MKILKSDTSWLRFELLLIVGLLAVPLLLFSQESGEDATSCGTPDLNKTFITNEGTPITLGENNWFALECDTNSDYSLSITLRVDGDVGVANGILNINLGDQSGYGPIGTAIILSSGEEWPIQTGVIIAEGNTARIAGPPAVGGPNMWWSDVFPVPVQDGYELSLQITIMKSLNDI